MKIKDYYNRIKAWTSKIVFLLLTNNFILFCILFVVWLMLLIFVGPLEWRIIIGIVTPIIFLNKVRLDVAASIDKDERTDTRYFDLIQEETKKLFDKTERLIDGISNKTMSAAQQKRMKKDIQNDQRYIKSLLDEREKLAPGIHFNKRLNSLLISILALSSIPSIIGLLTLLSNL